MKNFTLILLIFYIQFSYSQVGIGTNTPAPGYQLDVNGSLLVQKEFKTFPFSDVVSDYDNYKFLTRQLNSEPIGKVSKLDIGNIKVAPITVFDYVFTNLKRDDVNWVDLQFDANKYIVGLSNFRYEGENIRKGKVGNDFVIIGNFVSRTYVQGGTWRIEIENRRRNSTNDDAITYHVTLIVYDKKYFKELAPIEKDFLGQTTAEANSPLEP